MDTVAKHGIDDDRRVGQDLLQLLVAQVVRGDAAMGAHRDERGELVTRGLGHAQRRPGEDDTNGRTAIHEMAGGHETTAAVVPGPDRDDDALVAQVATELEAHHIGQVGPGLLHHLQEGDAEVLDRRAIHFGHLRSGDGRQGREGDDGKLAIDRSHGGTTSA